MAGQADNLLKSLLESGIVSLDGGASAAMDEQVSAESAEALVNGLLRDGKLSVFQAEEILKAGPAGLILNDYMLLDRIGSGGMGEVYLAMHRVMQRQVAIKRLPPHALEVAGLTERFLREVRTAAKLAHPNIVAAYDAGETDGTCYLVMEYVDGRDLSALLKEKGALPLAQAVDYLLQAARAVAFAHEAGIIHRDIKPANFLIDGQGTVKLLDLGLARVEQSLAEHEHSAQLTLTGPGRIMGTLAYMAPEQAEDPHGAGPAADLYALGCTFCHLLSGRPPFMASGPTQALLAHRDEAPPDLSGLLPAPLVALYEELLAKAPEDRPSSAQQLVGELEQLIADGVVPSWQHGGEASWNDSRMATLLDDPIAAPAEPLASAGGTSKQFASTALERKRLKERTGKRPQLMIWTGGLLGVLAISGGVVWFLTRARQPEPEVPPSPALVAPSRLISPAAAAQLQNTQARERGHQVELVNSIGMTLRYIPAARYRRGTSDEQIEWAIDQVTAEGLFDRYGDYILTEKPAVLVNIENPFYLGTTEVTVGQFREFVEDSGYKTTAESDGRGGVDFESGYYGEGFGWDHPGFVQTDEHPVVNITQDDAKAFCQWLSEKEGVAYTLPTDDQWEFAARAGSGGRWCFGDDPSSFYEYGWCYNNSPNSTKPAGTLKANRYGLHDMHGNAREWVLLNDSTAADETGTGIVRGGSFTKPPVLCRSASRVGFKADGPYPYHSFRVLRKIEE